MNVKNLQHDIEGGATTKGGVRAAPAPSDRGNAARLSEDGDLGGDAAVREATSTLATMLALFVGVAVLATFVVLRINRSRHAARLERTLLQLPSHGLDAVRRGVDHLVHLAA